MIYDDAFGTPYFIGDGVVWVSIVIRNVDLRLDYISKMYANFSSGIHYHA